MSGSLSKNFSARSSGFSTSSFFITLSILTSHSFWSLRARCTFYIEESSSSGYSGNKMDNVLDAQLFSSLVEGIFEMSLCFLTTSYKKVRFIRKDKIISIHLYQTIYTRLLKVEKQKSYQTTKLN